MKKRSLVTLALIMMSSAAVMALAFSAAGAFLYFERPQTTDSSWEATDTDELGEVRGIASDQAPELPAPGDLFLEEGTGLTPYKMPKDRGPLPRLGKTAAADLFPAPAPVPGSMWLLGSGLVGLAAKRIRGKKQV